MNIIVLKLLLIYFLKDIVFFTVGGVKIARDVVPEFIGEPSNVTAAVGKSARFSCHVKNLGETKNTVS